MGRRAAGTRGRVFGRLRSESCRRRWEHSTLAVAHVPPADPEIKFPTDWMPVGTAERPNNWIQVKKTDRGKFDASAGKETFEVNLKVNTQNGGDFVCQHG